MIRMLFIFALLFTGFFVGIRALRTLNGQEAWALTKTIGYSIMCSLLTIAVLVSIVIIF